MSKQQITGMRGVYTVAAELSRLGYIATTTSRSAKGVDLLVTDALGSVVRAVEVKADHRRTFWLVDRIVASPTRVYVFVRFRDTVRKPPTVDFYPVPSLVAAEAWTDRGDWSDVRLKDIAERKDKWEEAFG